MLTRWEDDRLDSGDRPSRSSKACCANAAALPDAIGRQQIAFGGWIGDGLQSCRFHAGRVAVQLEVVGPARLGQVRIHLEVLPRLDARPESGDTAVERKDTLLLRYLAGTRLEQRRDVVHFNLQDSAAG